MTYSTESCLEVFEDRRAIADRQEASPDELADYDARVDEQRACVEALEARREALDEKLGIPQEVTTP